MRALSLVVMGCLSLFADHASAQRRERWTAPVEPVLVSSSEGPDSRYEVVLALRATGDAAVVQDGRLFELQVTEATDGRRRPRTHRCSHPSRPRRVSAEPVVMHPGQLFGVALDLRAICWGRALAAIEAGASVSVRYTIARGRRAFVARSTSDAARASDSVTSIEAPSAFALPAAAEGEASDVIRLSALDLRGSRSITFRVAIHGPTAATRRAWIRPDRVRFSVRDPRGHTQVCELPRAGAAPIPDLFSRISSRRASRLSLDAHAYCPEDTFVQEGIYEVTPILELDEDGSAWELDALVGTFVGSTTPLRLRSGDGEMLRTVAEDDLRRLVR